MTENIINEKNNNSEIINAKEEITMENNKNNETIENTDTAITMAAVDNSKTKEETTMKKAVENIRYFWYLLGTEGLDEEQIKGIKKALYKVEKKNPGAIEAAKAEVREEKLAKITAKYGISTLCDGIITRMREIVKKADKITHMLSAAKRSEHTAYAIPSVFVTVEHQTTLKIVHGVQPTTAGYMTQYVEEHLVTGVLRNPLWKWATVDRLFMGQMYLSINDLCGLAEMLGEAHNLTEETGYKLDPNCAAALRMTLINGKWEFSVDRSDNETQLIYDKDSRGRAIPNKDWLYEEDGTLRDSWIYDFSYALSSAGAMKKNGIVLAGVYVGSNANKAFDWERTMDLMTCGSWRLACEYGEDTLSPGKIAQLSMRFAQQLAPQSIKTDAVPVPTALFVPGKFKAAGKEHMDGMFFVLAAYVARVLNELFPEQYVTDIAMVGQQFQCRPFNSLKGTGVTIDLTLVKAILAAYPELFGNGLVVINGEKADLETRREFYLYSANKGKEGKFGGKAVLIVYPSVLKKYFSNKNGRCVWPTIDIAGIKVPAPAMIADFNACKTGFDPVYKTGIRMMNNAHCDDDEGVTSVQTLQSLFKFDRKKTQTMIQNSVTKMIDKKAKPFFSTETSANAPQSFIGTAGIDWRSIMGKTIPALNNQYYKTAYKADGEKAVEGLAGNIGTCNFVTNAVTQMMMPDIVAAITGKEVLRTFTQKIRGKELTDYVEVYSTTVPAGTYGIMIRFPKAGSGEFIKVKVIDKETLAERIAAVCDEATAASLNHLLENLSAGIVIVPTASVILKGLGGADFDGDKCKIYFANQDFEAYDNGTAEPDEFDILCDVPSIIVDKDFEIK